MLILGFVLLVSGLKAQLDASVSIDAMVDTMLRSSLDTTQTTLADTDSILIEEDEKDAKQTVFLLRESDVLVRLNSMPIYTWNDDQRRHIKPLARDFNKLFDSSQQSDSISLENAFGVSLAGIKALSQDLRHYDIMMIDLQKSNGALARKTRTLQRVVEKQRKEMEMLKRQMADLMLKAGR